MFLHFIRQKKKKSNNNKNKKNYLIQIFSFKHIYTAFHIEINVYNVYNVSFLNFAFLFEILTKKQINARDNEWGEVNKTSI